MEIQQLEAARIIIGSMDLTGKKRTMKNWEVLLFRETPGILANPRCKQNMRKSIKNQDNLQRKSQDSKLQTGTQSPTLQKLSYAHPPQESERCLAESILKKHNFHQETKWKIPIIDSGVR